MYLLITAVFAFLLIGFSFYEQTTRLEQQARFLGEAYLPIVSEALWSFDDVQRDAVAAVLLHHEELRGVSFRFLDAEKKPVLVTHGNTLELPVGKTLTDKMQTSIDVFKKTGWIRLPVHYQDDRQPSILIGELTLFTNNQLAISRHLRMTGLTLIVSVLTTVLMWFVFRFVLARNLAEPLRYLVIKLLQVQKILPQTEIDPTTFRKLKIERFGTECKLLEKQLQKIIVANFELAEAAAHTAARASDAQHKSSDDEQPAATGSSNTAQGNTEDQDSDGGLPDSSTNQQQAANSETADAQQPQN